MKAISKTHVFYRKHPGHLTRALIVAGLLLNAISGLAQTALPGGGSFGPTSRLLNSYSSCRFANQAGTNLFRSCPSYFTSFNRMDGYRPEQPNFWGIPCAGERVENEQA